MLVFALGGIGALAAGAGFWAQWGRVLFTGAEESLTFGWWLLAGGAVLLGASIWLGTSGEPLLRVGDGGVAAEKGGAFGTLPLRRMPWHLIESIAYEGAGGAVVARGLDDSGAAFVVRARIASQPQGAAWIVSEGRARVPTVVQIGEEVILPEAHPDAGERLVLDPLQVVGKRCAASGTIIAYEPDARVCPRCERIYHKAHVPETCECGCSLSAPADGATASDPETQQASPA